MIIFRGGAKTRPYFRGGAETRPYDLIGGVAGVSPALGVAAYLSNEIR